MNTLGLSVLSSLALLVLFGSRRWALFAMVAGILYMTQGQFLVVGEFALYPMRVLEVTGLARVLARHELQTQQMGRLDRMLIVLYAFSVSVFVIRSNVSIAFQIGAGVDAFCLYAVFRSLIRHVDDLRWLLRGLAVMLVPYVYLVWSESLTYTNPFAVIGGVELIRAGDTWIREGRLRATGSFMHPSLLGTLGGTFLSIYIGLLFSRPADRTVAIVGIIACLGIVGASNSGGPMICVAAAVAGWLAWPARRAMHLVRRTLLVALACLAIIMNAPIWYVLARISSITGGDGYHRAVLLDIAFQNLDRWWYAGMPMMETASWLPYTNTNTGAADMTNNFLSFGINAGLGAILLLVALLVVAFSQIGRMMSKIRSNPAPRLNLEPLYWGLGVAIVVHAFNWMGITYWDQINAVWLLHLAVIGSLATTAQTLKSHTTVDNGEMSRRRGGTISSGLSRH